MRFVPYQSDNDKVRLFFDHRTQMMNFLTEEVICQIWELPLNEQEAYEYAVNYSNKVEFNNGTSGHILTVLKKGKHFVEIKKADTVELLFKGKITGIKWLRTHLFTAKEGGLKAAKDYSEQHGGLVDQSMRNLNKNFPERDERYMIKVGVIY